MSFSKVVLLSACIAAVTAIAPIEEFHIPKPYSFGYAIKDKHGEQHRQEIGDGLHKVRGSYGFKDERGIERQVNYIADKDGFRAEIKTNEPGTASLNPAGVKMESSAHLYFGAPKGKEAAAVAGKGFALDSELGFPGFTKFNEDELAKESGLAFDAGLGKESDLAFDAGLAKESGLAFDAGLAKESGLGFDTELVKEGGLAFDAGLAKENDLEKEAITSKISENLAFGGLKKFADESLALSPTAAEEGAKEAEAAKDLELSAGLGLKELYKNGFGIIPINIKAENEATLQKEGLAVEKALRAEELAKLGLIFPPSFAKKNLPFELMDPFLLQKGILGFGKMTEAFPFPQKFQSIAFPFASPLPFMASKPKGFIYGGPVPGGAVRGYDARFY